MRIAFIGYFRFRHLFHLFTRYMLTTAPSIKYALNGNVEIQNVDVFCCCPALKHFVIYVHRHRYNNTSEIKCVRLNEKQTPYSTQIMFSIIPFKIDWNE